MLLNIHNEESLRIRNKKFSSEWPFEAWNVISPRRRRLYNLLTGSNFGPKTKTLHARTISDEFLW
jgi:hypothetical protein